MEKEHAHARTNSSVALTTTVRSADVSCASRHFLCETGDFMVVLIVSNRSDCHKRTIFYSKALENAQTHTHTHTRV
jgi:hypothetical protein